MQQARIGDARETALYLIRKLRSARQHTHKNQTVLVKSGGSSVHFPEKYRHLASSPRIQVSGRAVRYPVTFRVHVRTPWVNHG